jgi:hypothetical protein
MHMNFRKPEVQGPPRRIRRGIYLKEIVWEARFLVLTAASMKMTVFWNVASCSLVANCCLHRHKLLPCSHTAQHPRRQSSSKYIARLWTGFIWFRIRSTGSYEHDNQLLGSIKTRGNVWLPERLLLLINSCSMQLVSDRSLYQILIL